MEQPNTSGPAPVVGSITFQTRPMPEPAYTYTFGELPYTFKEYAVEALPLAEDEAFQHLEDLPTDLQDFSAEQARYAVGIALRALNTFCKRTGVTLEEAAKRSLDGAPLAAKVGSDAPRTA